MIRKRIFDFSLALALFVPALIICAFLAPLVFLDVRATPIFRQTRIGKNNVAFSIFKLRTMKADTVNVASHEVPQSQITWLGSFLRRFKLDELPQLYNVLNGTMSFVGPRPCLPSQNELIEERTSRNVSSLLPGITGPAQLAGLDMSTPRALAIADSAYVRAWSIGADLKILFQTFMGGGRGDAAFGSPTDAKPAPSTQLDTAFITDSMLVKIRGRRERVVVTGASGFLGTAVVATLAADGWQVVSLVRSLQTALSSSSVVQHCFEDLATADLQELALIMAGADCVIHLAAVVPGKRADSGGGTVAIASAVGAAATLASVPRMIVLSSAYAALAETGSMNAREYGREKLEADRALAQYRSDDLEMVFLRPPVVYGQGMSGSMSKLITMVGKGVPIPFGLAREKRFYISKTNLVDLIAVLVRAHRDAWEYANGRAYTPTDGVAFSTAELTAAIGQSVGRRARLMPVPLPLLRMAGRLMGMSEMLNGAIEPLLLNDNARLLKDFGWTPVEQIPLSLKNWINPA
jgi:O-antigen biosynthesis protein WbqP